MQTENSKRRQIFWGTVIKHLNLEFCRLTKFGEDMMSGVEVGQTSPNIWKCSEPHCK